MSLKIIQISNKVSKDYWDWEIHLEGDKDDLEKIKYVEYVLHETFPDPIRKISDRGSGFQLETSGWGTFTVYLTIKLKSGLEIEKPFAIAFNERKEKSVSL